MTLEVSALKGMYPAFPTPFTADGAIDTERLHALVDTLIANGATGLVPVGGTGEYTALSPAERTLVVRATVEAARGRVPVVAGVVSPGYAEALDAGQAFVDAGAAALLLVTPFYVTPSDAGVRAYFQRYRDAAGVPLLLYDIPARTRYATPPATIASMAKEDGTIIGMKACNTDLNAFARTVALAGKDMAILSGDDLLYVHHVLLGAVGGILTSASLLPKAWARIHASAANGDAATALREHAMLAPMLDAIFSETNPGPAKKAFELLGDGLGPVRLPLVEPAAATVARMKEALAGLPKGWLP
ncbi:4-hydroxy-tetrahydrodipicolinate synthase [Caballeronia sp. LZ043]|uniref:4-hydroxy-tetrahydrodipicolinate synthase n=1 Tax=Caballeronia sp. LZ043 TaxID=3038569 RepID=UPI00285466EA|nr:4-hydroxy-tetrahydrodipicolinate synthase [Caballeronia sp. LZ043]MDR5825869.1 4-hydroxy-tetrahydrodipicolinate synthase [Caballeronia sp. LZ043]